MFAYLSWGSKENIKKALYVKAQKIRATIGFLLNLRLIELRINTAMRLLKALLLQRIEWSNYAKETTIALIFDCDDVICEETTTFLPVNLIEAEGLESLD